LGIIYFDVDAEEIETVLFGRENILADHPDIPGCVNTVGVIRLIKRSAHVNRGVIQTKQRGGFGIFGRAGIDFSHSKITVNLIQRLISILQL
jgi:hypothetical protein